MGKEGRESINKIIHTSGNQEVGTNEFTVKRRIKIRADMKEKQKPEQTKPNIKQKQEKPTILKFEPFGKDK